MKISCQLNGICRKFQKLIPIELAFDQKKKRTDFTRKRKLPFRQLIAFILYLVVGDKNKSVDSKSGLFFKNARRCGLLPDAQAVHRSSVAKARKKVPWLIFQTLLQEAVSLAYELWPENDKYLWRGMSVFAIDGSNYILPATKELKKEFDPSCGLENPGKGHYPQCLVSTLYDVFRGLPIARTVASYGGSEREEAKKLLPFIPPESLILFDRGYPSYELLLELTENNEGYFLFRCRTKATFSVVKAFAQSGKKEDEICINPSDNYKNKVGAGQAKKLKPIKLRAIRLVNPDGETSILLTNMFDEIEFPRSEIIDLYYKRWEIEVGYRHEKISLKVEAFHGKTSNSVRQELFAAAIMTVIARTMMVVADQVFNNGEKESQFKNAVNALAPEILLLVVDKPQIALQLFRELLKEIARVKYYRSKTKRPSQPRITKRRANEWIINRNKRKH